jgi:DNA-binding NarL/FixJ family response regulator
LIDFAIVDFGMKEIRGDAVIREIKSLYPKMTTILMSGCQRDELREAAESAGSDGFLSKPFTLDELRASIQKMALKTTA